MRLHRLPSQEFRSSGYRRAAAAPYFSLRTKDNAVGELRVGIVVGAAVHKSAAKRNFWRRQARETVRDALRAREVRGRDLLIVLFPKVKAVAKKEFREKLGSALREELH